MRLKLIYPSRYLSDGRVLRTKRLLFPSLTLPLLAALTPPDIDVRIETDCFGEINFDAPVDLVGITATTSRARRAYDIAREFRRRDVPVVMGGIHASMMPEEALEHVDTVIAGEADEIWPRYLDDFRRGNPQRLYRVETRPSLERLPVPRYSLLDMKRYWLGRRNPFRPLPLPMYPVQTARGCPHACDFCSVSVFSGRVYRPRPVADVVEEIKTLGARSVFFLDDNIFADPSRSRELCEALIPLRLGWGAQCTISAAKNRDLLSLACRSGCKVLFLGLESVAPQALASVSKRFNRVEDYEKNLTVFREEGISVIAAMVFGLDGENKTIFPDAYDFLMRNRVPYTSWHMLTPLPGTPLFARYAEEGRLKAPRWWLTPDADTSRTRSVAFTGLPVAEADFVKSYHDYHCKFYSWPSIARRILLPPQKRCMGKLHFNRVLRRNARADINVMEGWC